MIDKKKGKNEPPPTEGNEEPPKLNREDQNAEPTTIDENTETTATYSQLNQDNNNNNNNENDNDGEEQVDEDECFPVDPPIRRHQLHDEILNQISDDDLLKIAEKQLSMLDLEYEQCINSQKLSNNAKQQQEQQLDNPSSENYTAIPQTINSEEDIVDDDDDDDDDHDEGDNLFNNDPNYIRKPHKPLESETNAKIKDIINTLPPPKYPKWVESIYIYYIFILL